MNCLYFKKLKGSKDSKKCSTKLFKTSFGTTEVFLEDPWIPVIDAEEWHENVVEEARGEEAPQAEPQENHDIVVGDGIHAQIQREARPFRRTEPLGTAFSGRMWRTWDDIRRYLETHDVAPNATTWVIHT